MYRILVTGSRDWQADQLVHDELWDLLERHPEGVCLVQGGCPSGADYLARRWAEFAQEQGYDVQLETYEADWKLLGRKAGPVRNQEMVDDGADICLAFIRRCTSPKCTGYHDHGSHGAEGCAKLAEQAGIQTIRIPEWA